MMMEGDIIIYKDKNVQKQNDHYIFILVLTSNVIYEIYISKNKLLHTRTNYYS